MKKKYIMSGMTVFIMVFIFWQSSLPADLSQRESDLLSVFIANLLHISDDAASFAVRKCAHFLEYMVLGLSLIHTVRGWSGPSSCSGHSWHPISDADNPKPDSQFIPPGRIHSFANNRISLFMICTAWGIAILYAVTDELHQIYVPGRSFGIRDIVIDSLGALTGIFIPKLIAYHKSRTAHFDAPPDPLRRANR